MENQLNTSRSKRTAVKSLAIVILVFAVAFLGTNCTKKPLEDLQVKAMVDKMNKGCPVQFDPYTSLQSVKLVGDKTIQYNYAVSEITNKQINLDTAKKYIFTGLLKKMKESPEAKPLRDLEVTLKHRYTDKNGALIIEYVITPEMYKKGNNKLYDKKSSS